MATSLATRVGTGHQTIGGSENDQTLACNVISHLDKLGRQSGSRKQLGYAFNTNNNRYFEVRIFHGIDVITGDDIRQLAAQSQRVSDVRLFPGRNTMHVEVRRSGNGVKAVGFCSFAEQSERKVRNIGIDWDKSGISEEDDKHTILSLIDEVYNIKRRVPDIRCWIEPLTVSGNAPDASVDASESGVASIADTDVVAHAICFTSLDPFSGSFLTHLQRKYDGRLLQSQFWLHPPASAGESAILVLLVRKSNQTAEQVSAVAERYVPSGDPVAAPVEPAKKRRKAF